MRPTPSPQRDVRHFDNQPGHENNLLVSICIASLIAPGLDCNDLHFVVRSAEINIRKFSVRIENVAEFSSRISTNQEDYLLLLVAADHQYALKRAMYCKEKLTIINTIGSPKGAVLPLPVNLLSHIDDPVWFALHEVAHAIINACLS